MNNIRKTRLSKCVREMHEIADEVDAVKMEEEDVRDNTPENLQGTERYEICEAACAVMEEAVDLLNDVIEKLEEIDGVGA